MGNVMRVLKRDLLRLLKNPAALVVVGALIILPSLYTWFNVAGFWNPYDNTGNMRVCVVNEDEGAYAELTGELDLGSQIMDTLETNDQLGWAFTDYDTAMEEVRSGKAYAAFVIPKEFSYDVTTLLTGDYTQPTLEYYVNEKAGAVSPKITDAGANTLDETINSTFTATVSEVVTEKLNEALAESEASIDASKTSAAAQIERAKASIASASQAVSELSASATSAQGTAAQAKQTLQDSKGQLDSLSTQLNETAALLDETQRALAPFISQTDSTLNQASVMASTAANNTNQAIQQVNSTIADTSPQIAEALTQAGTAIAQNNELIAQLQTIVNDASLTDEQRAQAQAAIDYLQAQNDSLNTTVEGLSKANTEIAQASSDIAAAGTKVNNAAQGTLSATDEYRATLQNQTFPALSAGATKLSAALRSLSGAVASQVILVDQAALTLDQLSSALSQTSSALNQTNGLLGSFSQDLDVVETDVLALGTSGVLADLFGDDGLDPEKIADFMFSPSTLQDEVLYPVNAYGSAMAPLFMNMTLWIGVFMLLVILRQEVDHEGIKNLTAQQSYVARWLFLAPLAALQAIVCCAGNLVLGVEAASTPLFFLTAVMASLTYLSIQYALAVLLQHIGMGLCVILIFVQIPGATGLYPIEMTTDFFRAVYVAFPFTYGINALRETIAGFYGWDWAKYMAIMAVFFVLFMVIGTKIRPYSINLNRMFANQIRESGILNGEDVELPARRYRTERLFILMANRQEFRDVMGQRVEKFLGWYPRLHRNFPIVGFVGLAVATIVLSALGIEKVITLTVWLLWLVFMLIFMVVIEFVRDRMEHEVSLGNLSDAEVTQLFQARDGVSDSPAPAPSIFRKSILGNRKPAHAKEGAHAKGAHAKEGAHAKGPDKVNPPKGGDE